MYHELRQAGTSQDAGFGTPVRRRRVLRRRFPHHAPRRSSSTHEPEHETLCKWTLRSEPPYVEWRDIQRGRPPADKRADDLGRERGLRESVMGVTKRIDDAVAG